MVMLTVTDDVVSSVAIVTRQHVTNSFVKLSVLPIAASPFRDGGGRPSGDPVMRVVNDIPGVGM